MPTETATAEHDGDRLLTIKEVAAWLRQSEKSVWLSTAPRGSLKPVRIGRSVRYRAGEVRRFIAELESGGSKSDAA